MFCFKCRLARFAIPFACPPCFFFFFFFFEKGIYALEMTTNMTKDRKYVMKLKMGVLFSEKRDEANFFPFFFLFSRVSRSAERQGSKFWFLPDGISLPLGDFGSQSRLLATQNPKGLNLIILRASQQFSRWFPPYRGRSGFWVTCYLERGVFGVRLGWAPNVAAQDACSNNKMARGREFV
jgi:hypothetical protein